jgi:formylmethanofuran dehydrogenase subunit E
LGTLASVGEIPVVAGAQADRAAPVPPPFRASTRTMRVAAFWMFALASCARPVPAPSSPPATSQEAALAAVTAVHGGAGPWVVAGYRMGEHALQRLGLARGSFDLEVIHHAPREVQYSCIADGAAAATGASLGRLNLSLVESAAPETRTTYRRRSTGQTLTLRTTHGFAERYANVPRPQLRAAGETVLRLADSEIFEEVSQAE